MYTQLWGACFGADPDSVSWGGAEFLHFCWVARRCWGCWFTGHAERANTERETGIRNTERPSEGFRSWCFYEWT